jgi:hypothetical protein
MLGRSLLKRCPLCGAGGMITFRDPDNIQLEVFAAG